MSGATPTAARDALALQALLGPAAYVRATAPRLLSRREARVALAQYAAGRAVAVRRALDPVEARGRWLEIGDGPEPRDPAADGRALEEAARRACADLTGGAGGWWTPPYDGQPAQAGLDESAARVRLVLEDEGLTVRLVAEATAAHIHGRLAAVEAAYAAAEIAIASALAGARDRAAVELAPAVEAPAADLESALASDERAAALGRSLQAARSRPRAEWVARSLRACAGLRARAAREVRP